MKTPKENLPKFLYKNCEGLIAVGVHGDSVVEDEWNEWIAQQELNSERWIPVGERLPKGMGDIPCHIFFDGTVSEATFYRDENQSGFYFMNYDFTVDHAVTHWKERVLPQPPKPNQD